MQQGTFKDMGVGLYTEPYKCLLHAEQVKFGKSMPGCEAAARFRVMTDGRLKVTLFCMETMAGMSDVTRAGLKGPS